MGFELGKIGVWAGIRVGESWAKIRVGKVGVGADPTERWGCNSGEGDLGSEKGLGSG